MLPGCPIQSIKGFLMIFSQPSVFSSFVPGSIASTWYEAMTHSMKLSVESGRSTLPPNDLIFTSAPLKTLIPSIIIGSEFMQRKWWAIAPSIISGPWSVHPRNSSPCLFVYSIFSAIVEYACWLTDVWVCMSSVILYLSILSVLRKKTN